jgi:hypothetical protein
VRYAVESAGVAAPAAEGGVARPLGEGPRNTTASRDERLPEPVSFRLTPFEDAARAAMPRGPASSGS